MSLLVSLLALETLQALSAVDASLTNGDPEIAITPTDVAFVEARQIETVVRGRPWVPHKRIATITRGTRLVVRGRVESRDEAGCSGDPWYAVLPFGFVCSKHVRPTTLAPEPGPALSVDEGKRLPHAYALVREDGTPIYADAAAVEAGLPSRTLTRGMSLVVRRSVAVGDVAYLELQSGELVSRDHAAWMGQGSAWHGVGIEAAEPGPLFAWVTAERAPVRTAPSDEAEIALRRARRERVPLLEREGDYWRTGEGQWMLASALDEVHVIDPPEGVLTEFRHRTTGNDQWIDVDVGEQVLVAYRGRRPVYATMVSSGRASPTPVGNYPVWAKVASMDMANQGYEDKPYMVQGVPWVLLFQGHNALHGAYWHDRFGERKSHGCVNLSPTDARFLFEWVGPDLPAGWTGYLPPDLRASPVVHVRDSSRLDGATFTQERPWGPPDLEAERAKTEAAEHRRALAAAEEETSRASEPAPPPRLQAPARPELVPPV